MEGWYEDDTRAKARRTDFIGRVCILVSVLAAVGLALKELWRFIG